MLHQVVREWSLIGWIVLCGYLHESARSFSQAAESIGLARSGRGLAMAWIGKDVRVWHRRIAYQVCTTKCCSSDKYIVIVLILFTQFV